MRGGSATSHNRGESRGGKLFKYTGARQRIAQLGEPGSPRNGIARRASRAVQASTGYSALTLPTGDTVPLLNKGVLVVPKTTASDVASAAVVTHGNREQASGAHMTVELLNARFNHHRAKVLRLLPQCTRDAPKAWADIARNIACDDCLRANSDVKHSTAHMPVAKAAGDLVSYDICYVSVPHIHSGQQHVINFHDHYSTLNMPYLLARKSDAFKAIQHYVTFCSSH
eukprot:6184453-Pleurochrysis_carterae.AAC.1